MLKTVIALVLCLVAPRIAAAADEKPLVPVRVQIVLTRYQGDKKVSSLPYTLVVNANKARSILKMGSQVPISAGPAPAGKELPAFQYRDVGINIDCVAEALDDGRFRVDLTMDDSSVYSEDAAAASRSAGFPSFRQFRLSQQIVLKDGQSREFVAATDKINGEVTKVEISLNVVK